jgi:hypothetical protein
MATTLQHKTSTAPNKVVFHAPSDSLMKLVNPLIKALFHSPLEGGLSKQLILLTFTGRKSGKTFTTPVGYTLEGDTLVAFTHRQWWKNLVTGAPVAIRFRGKDYKVKPEVVTNSVKLALKMQAYLRENGLKSARAQGLSFDYTREPSLEELREGLEGRAEIRIKLPAGALK